MISGAGLDLRNRRFAATDQLAVARDTLEVGSLFERRGEGDIVLLHEALTNRIGLEADDELVSEPNVEFCSELAVNGGRSKGSRELLDRLGVLLPDVREVAPAGQHRGLLAVVGPELLDQRVVGDRVVGERGRHVEIAHVAECLHADTRKQERPFLSGIGDAVRLNEEGELRLVELPLDCLRVEAVDGAEYSSSKP